MSQPVATRVVDRVGVVEERVPPTGPLWTWPPANLGMPPQMPRVDGRTPCPAWTPRRNPDFPEWLRVVDGQAIVEVSFGVPTEGGAPRVDGAGGEDDVAVDARSCAWLPTRTRWFRATNETMDAAWWRQHIPGVAYKLKLLRGGLDCPGDATTLDDVGSDERPGALVVEVARRVTLILPGGGRVFAELTRVGEDGIPTYSAALTPELVQLGRAVRSSS